MDRGLGGHGLVDRIGNTEILTITHGELNKERKRGVRFTSYLPNQRRTENASPRIGLRELPSVRRFMHMALRLYLA